MTYISTENQHCYLEPMHYAISAPGVSDTQMDAYIEGYLSLRAQMKKQGLSFEGILDQTMGQRSAKHDISIPIGRKDNGEVGELVIGRDGSHHGLMVGSTGSGKSTLIHAIIMSAIWNYSSEELNLYLLDFKGGMEFNVYDGYRLPHIKYLALDDVQEYGESILRNLELERKRRKDLCTQAGVKDLESYRDKTGKPMPRILVIVDEFQKMFKRNSEDPMDTIGANCESMVADLLREGRAYGIHLLAATQTSDALGGFFKLNEAINQMNIRIGLSCDMANCRFMFGSHAESAAEIVKRTHTACLNQNYLTKENTAVKVAYCDDESRQSLIDRIEAAYPQGEKPKALSSNQVTDVMTDIQKGLAVQEKRVGVSVSLGENIRLDPPRCEINFNRKRHNTLICGTDKKKADNLVDSFVLSVLHSQAADVYYMDGDRIIGEDEDTEYRCDMFQAMGSHFHVADSDDDPFGIFRALGESAETSIDFPSEPMGNRRCQISSQTFMDLIENGYRQSVHVIISATDYRTVNDCMQQNFTNTLDLFPERVLFALDDQSLHALGTFYSNQSIRENMACRVDERKNTSLFKPYRFPEENAY